MRKFLVAAMILGSLSSIGMVGCDRAEEKKSETTKAPDGSSSTSTEKTVQHNDGSVTSEQKSKTTTP